MLAETSYAKDIDELRAKLGLDRPFHVQYVEWLGRAVRGDLGESLWTRRAVVDELAQRSEEHTSELQSLRHLVCRLLLEKKKKHMTFKDMREAGVAQLQLVARAEV